jgi:hypothetical protein
MNVKITNWLTGETILDVEAESVKAAVEAAIAIKTNFAYADLRRANLSDANLRRADLRDADLRDANLRRADLSDANLRRADLRDANLRDANLRRADLRDANLRRADLRDANLSDANLRDANLTPIRDDFWAVLSATPREVEGLRLAIIEGRVDGSTYNGECACLVGTIANVRHVDVSSLGALKPNSSRPIERFFLAINKGDKPETSQHSKLVLDWLDEWLFNMKAAFCSPAPAQQ